MQQDDDQLAAFGEFVRAQRRLAQVSQRNLARMSGVSDSYLSQLERGNYRPSPQVVKALAQAFNLEPKQLYTMLGFMDDDGQTRVALFNLLLEPPRWYGEDFSFCVRADRAGIPIDALVQGTSTHDGQQLDLGTLTA